MPSAISQIPRRMIGGDTAQSDSLLFKPSAKARSEPNLMVNRDSEYPCLLSDLANGPICDARGPSGARERTTWQSIIHFTVDSFPQLGADGRSQYYVVCDFAHLPEILGWRTGTRHSQEG